MIIRDYTDYREDEVLALYESVGWTNYLQRAERLPAAFRGSLCVLGAWEDGQLVGLLRAVGDGVTILFVQDLLVLPDYQRRGIAAALVRTLCGRYPSVYQIELLTDDTEQTRAFYHALGFAAAEEIGCTSFVRM